MKLLSRDEFRQVIMCRDGYRCVICKKDQDLTVHHIMDRALFEDGGYYEENGATLCPKCHIVAEAGFLLPKTIWLKIGINSEKFTYPSGFNKKCLYDKWGNEVLIDFPKYYFIVAAPEKFAEKYEKAIRLAGGIVRVVNPEWLFKYENISFNRNAWHVAKLKPFKMYKTVGKY